MSRKHAALYDEDDLFDEEEEEWYDEYEEDDFDAYDDFPQRKPTQSAASSSKKSSKAGNPPAAGRGKVSSSQVAAASISALSTKSKVKPFTFDTPSPDDVISEAQSGRKINSSQQAAAELGQSAAEGLAGLRVGGGQAPQPPAAGAPKPRPLEEYKMDAKLTKACAEAAAGGGGGGGRHTLHLAVLGHVDAGKSTLMGRLLHDLGAVDQRTVHKHEKEAAQAGKASFSWAWLLDERPEERSRGVTVDVAVRSFKTPGFDVLLLDAPGHRDFIPNMIAGAAQADAALLLVDGSRGGFESGFEGDGQTREHAQLARSLGIEQIIVVVSKLDTCDFEQQRFLDIKAAMAPFLRSCGFREEAVQWLPAVGPSGQNLTQPPTEERLRQWWDGDTLVGAIDKFSLPHRDLDRPFRMPVSEVVRSRALGGDAASGKVEAGALMAGMRVMVQPGGQIGSVKALEVNGHPVELVRAGDAASVGLSGLDTQVLLSGTSVLCHPEWPCPIGCHVEAKLLILDVEMPIVAGQPATVHLHVSKEEGSILRLAALLDPKTGEVKKARPRCLLKGQTGIVELEFARTMCVECFCNVRPLGRIALRDQGRTIAVGIVQRVLG